MPPSYQVRLSIIFKLGHTRWNQRLVIITTTVNRRGIIASIMRRTRPDPAGVFFKIRPFKLPNPSFHPHSFIIPPISLSFKLPPSLPLSTDHCSPIILQSPKSVNLLVGAAVVGVFLVIEYLSFLFSPMLRYVSLISTHFALHFCLLISISLVLRRMLFPLYDMSNLGSKCSKLPC